MSYRFRHECPEGCKVFVGNLDRNTGREDLRHVFGRFGRVLDVWMATTPPGFAFVMYAHRDAAREAVRRMNNARVDGRFVTVELATGVPRDDRRHRRDRSRSPQQSSTAAAVVSSRDRTTDSRPPVRYRSRSPIGRRVDDRDERADTDFRRMASNGDRCYGNRREASHRPESRSPSSRRYRQYRGRDGRRVST
ncbi:unnamed protein product, partial [Medioppia subpectinata]